MAVETVISLIIVVFVAVGAAYDVELSREARALHSRRYRWRRLQNWFPMGIAYAAFYMARYNVAAGNVSSVRDALGFSSSFMGWVMSAGSWAYAATAPFTGQITDRIGGKNGMVLACAGAALCNLSLGLLFHMKQDVPMAVEQLLFIVLYAGNVLVQGFGTSAVVKINAAWYSAGERGIFAGVFNIMLTSGYFLSLGTGSSIIATLGWEYVFVIPGAVLFVMASAIACWVKNTPNESTKVRFVVGARGAAIINAAQEQDGLSKSEQMHQLLLNYTFLGYLAAVFFLSWSRDGFLNWFYSFFDAVRAAPLTSADTAVIGGAWTIGGFVGGLLCGWLSDVLFKSDRVMPICIFSVFQAVVLGLLYYCSATCSVAMLGVLVFFCSVFLLGNYTLLSYTVPSDLPQDIAAGASGIMTCVAYFSTGLSGAVMGHLIDSGGYSLWIVSLVVASILAGMSTAVGSYFSPHKSGMMIDETELSAALEAMDEFTPLSSRSHSKRRASIVRLSADFIASPMPNPRSTRSNSDLFASPMPNPRSMRSARGTFDP